MLSLIYDPADVCRELGVRARQLRLEHSWTQAELARRSGVALSTLRVFERTGQISLERLVMIASTLRGVDAFEKIFEVPQPRSLAEIEARQSRRQRGRRAKR